MTKERLKSPRLRLFVALEISGYTRGLLAAWQRKLVGAGEGELRASSVDSLHVTLAFLGHRYEKDLDLIASCVKAVKPRAVPLAFESNAAPQPASRPRLYAAAVVPAAALIDLRAETATRLSEAAGFKDEGREYWPHVTLCRVKSSVKRHRAIDPLIAAPRELLEPAAAIALTLFSSELKPQGAVHTALATTRLPGLSV